MFFSDLIWRRSASCILSRWERLQFLSDTDLTQRVQESKWELLARKRRRWVQFEIYAATVEAIRRQTGMLLRPVQIRGALGLAERCVIEMQTGEGKTLTAVPAVAYFALKGRGCHVVTSNPYLAERDANSLRAIYQRLGLSVGCVLPNLNQAQRQQAYDCDIVYGTASEFGFDFLRDRLQLGAESMTANSSTRLANDTVHRGFSAAIIDEADSVLIDEASTPLIIGTEVQATAGTKLLYEWANKVATELLTEMDFVLDPSSLTAHLTEQGARRIILQRKPAPMDSLSSEDIFEQTERAIVARHLLIRDRDYLVKEQELTLVSGSTGRRLVGRKWQKGLHQAVEVKEGLLFSKETMTSARITIQEYFGLYTHLSGMTGTAKSASRELKRFYRMSVCVIPPHKKCLRKRYPDRVFVDEASKHEAIIDRIVREIAGGRAVLVGTPSVDSSERLATALARSQIPYRLLNASQDAEEADVIANAGQLSAVTIATNMAGRGTDIQLNPQVKDAGGLHVIVTEVHASRRIDRQIVGRAARQGEPGSCEFFISRDDEIWILLPKMRPSKLRIRMLINGGIRPFLEAQLKLERHAERQRAKMFQSARRYRQALRDAGVDLFLETNH